MLLFIYTKTYKHICACVEKKKDNNKNSVNGNSAPSIIVFRHANHTSE